MGNRIKGDVIHQGQGHRRRSRFEEEVQSSVLGMLSLLYLVGVMQIELLSRQVALGGKYWLEIWSGKLLAKKCELKTWVPIKPGRRYGQ